MGLDDLIPDEAETPSRSSSGASSQSTQEDEKEWAVDVGTGEQRKQFTEEKWESVKQVLIDEFGENPQEVLHKPSEERYEILHEAVLIANKKKTAEESDHRSKTRCDYCGKACDGAYVEIAGKNFHVHHTAGQIENTI